MPSHSLRPKAIFGDGAPANHQTAERGNVGTTSQSMEAVRSGCGTREATSSLLVDAFGPAATPILDRVQSDCDAENRSVGAAAMTRGSEILLGSGVTMDGAGVDDLAILAEEVAHALGDRTLGADAKAVDDPSDASERLARSQGDRLAAFVRSGGDGPVPQLSAAPRTSHIHRHASGEHYNIVGNMETLLTDFQESGPSNPGDYVRDWSNPMHTLGLGEEIDPEVLALMQEKVQIGSHRAPNEGSETPVEVDGADLTALFGDYFSKRRVDNS